MFDESRFKNKKTLTLFYGQRFKGFSSDLAQRAQNKLAFVYDAASLGDLAIPPSNNLERLGGDRKGQWSIRINKQWRICFEWQHGQAINIEVIDYH